MLLHGHLDVVPADPAEWSVHPFSGAVQDGYLWGRGAVDMKDMVAMILAIARRFRRAAVVPPRELVFAFLADEEAGGAFGSQWLVDNRPDLFEGCTEALGEVGGFSVTLGENVRIYPLEIAEKDTACMRLRVRGNAGHGSMVHQDNAVTHLAEVVARLGRHRFPVVLTDSADQFLASVTKLTGLERPHGPHDRRDAARHCQPDNAQRRRQANVVPSTAEAVLDCRVLPGREAAFERELDGLLGPHVEREWLTHLPSLQTTFDGELVAAMNSALRAEDPAAHLVPYMFAGGTDAKAFSRLGIRCFGFTPLLLPPNLDFTALFHGIDERVPVDALRFGTRVLDRFLQTMP